MDGHAPDVFLHGWLLRLLRAFCCFCTGIASLFGGLTGWLWGCCALELSVPLWQIFSHMQSWAPHAFNVADSDQHPALSALWAAAG